MRIACVHMCGFSARMDAAELAFATRVPNNDAALTAVARSGVSRILDRPITPSSRSCKFRPLAREDGSRAKLEFVRPPFLCSAERRFFVPATTRKARRAQRLSRSATRKRRDRMSGAAGVPDGVESGATMAQSGERSALGCFRQRVSAGRMVRVAPTRIIGLARHHHLPGDARGLVGERDRGELGRLAGNERHEPGRSVGLAAPDLLNDGGCATYKERSERLVAGAGDPALPRLAAGRVILGRQTEPGGEIAARAALGSATLAVSVTAVTGPIVGALASLRLSGLAR
jgi:hypothetical protein